MVFITPNESDKDCLEKDTAFTIRDKFMIQKYQLKNSGKCDPLNGQNISQFIGSCTLCREEFHSKSMAGLLGRGEWFSLLTKSLEEA